MRAGLGLRLAAGSLAVIATIALSSCSSSSSSSPGTGSTPNGSSATTQHAQAEAKAALAQSTKPLAWEPPGPAFKAASGLSGKQIYFIVNGLNFPFTQEILSGVKQAASLFRMTVVAEDTQSSTVVASRQIEQAVSRRVAAIVIDGVQANAVTAAIKDAANAHVPVIDSGDFETAQKSGNEPESIFGNVTASYAQAGQMMAEIAVAKLGDVHAVFIASPDSPHSIYEQTGFQNELTKLCAACSVRTVDVPLANWATGVGPATTTAVTDPTVNVLAVLYDAELPYVLPALKAAGATHPVSVVTYNATLPGMQELAKGAPVIGDPGASNTWTGWQIFDQALRALSGKPPAIQLTPNRAFTPEVVGTLSLTNAASNTAEWFTNANLQSEFSKLWGLG